jgi:transcriptional regulator
MYVPRHFAFPEGAESALHDLIEAHNFGLLVADAGGGAPPEAAHLPFVLDRDRGALGTLIAHVARANPIWRRFYILANTDPFQIHLAHLGIIINATT